MKTNLKQEREWLSKSTTSTFDPRKLPSHAGRKKVGSIRTIPSLSDYKVNLPMSQYMPELEQPNKVKSLLKMIKARGIDKPRTSVLATPYQVLQRKVGRTHHRRKR